MKRSFLTILLGLTAVLYHVYNFRHGAFLRPFAGWSRFEVEASFGGESFALPLLTRGDAPEARDAASKRIGEAGYVMAYEAGRLPAFIFSGRKDPLHRLYLRDEIRFQFEAARALVEKGFTPRIRAFIESLEKRGVTVIVLPVPTKIAIDRDRLPRALPQDSLWEGKSPRGKEDPYAVYKAYVDAAPEHVVDLHRAYVEYHQLFKSAEIYVPSDTHWSSLGIALAVSEVIKKLKALGWSVREPTIRYVYSSPAVAKFDLLAALELPESYLSTAPQLGWREPMYDVPPVTDSSSAHKVVVAGSCYAIRLAETDGNEPAYGLGAVLGRALGMVSAETNLANVPAAEPLARLVASHWLLERGDLLVWEFAAKTPPGESEELPIPSVVPEEGK